MWQTDLHSAQDATERTTMVYALSALRASSNSADNNNLAQVLEILKTGISDGQVHVELYSKDIPSACIVGFILNGFSKIGTVRLSSGHEADFADLPALLVAAAKEEVKFSDDENVILDTAVRLMEQTTPSIVDAMVMADYFKKYGNRAMGGVITKFGGLVRYAVGKCTPEEPAFKALSEWERFTVADYLTSGEVTPAPETRGALGLPPTDRIMVSKEYMSNLLLDPGPRGSELRQIVLLGQLESLTPKVVDRLLMLNPTYSVLRMHDFFECSLDNLNAADREEVLRHLFKKFVGQMEQDITVAKHMSEQPLMARATGVELFGDENSPLATVVLNTLNATVVHAKHVRRELNNIADTLR